MWCIWKATDSWQAEITAPMMQFYCCRWGEQSHTLHNLNCFLWASLSIRSPPQDQFYIFLKLTSWSLRGSWEEKMTQSRFLPGESSDCTVVTWGELLRRGLVNKRCLLFNPWSLPEELQGCGCSGQLLEASLYLNFPLSSSQGLCCSSKFMCPAWVKITWI